MQNEKESVRACAALREKEKKCNEKKIELWLGCCLCLELGLLAGWVCVCLQLGLFAEWVCVFSVQVLPCSSVVLGGDLADTYTFQNHFHDIQQMFVLVEQIC